MAERTLDIGIENLEPLDAPSDAGDFALGVAVGVAAGLIVVGGVVLIAT